MISRPILLPIELATERARLFATASPTDCPDRAVGTLAAVLVRGCAVG